MNKCFGVEHIQINLAVSTVKNLLRLHTEMIGNSLLCWLGCFYKINKCVYRIVIPTRVAWWRALLGWVWAQYRRLSLNMVLALDTVVFTHSTHNILNVCLLNTHLNVSCGNETAPSRLSTSLPKWPCMFSCIYYMNYSIHWDCHFLLIYAHLMSAFTMTWPLSWPGHAVCKTLKGQGHRVPPVTELPHISCCLAFANLRANNNN